MTPLLKNPQLLVDLKNKNTSNISNLYNCQAQLLKNIESADLVAIMINSDEFKNMILS